MFPPSLLSLPFLLHILFLLSSDRVFNKTIYTSSLNPIMVAPRSQGLFKLNNNNGLASRRRKKTRFRPITHGRRKHVKSVGAVQFSFGGLIVRKAAFFEEDGIAQCLILVEDLL